MCGEDDCLLAGCLGCTEGCRDHVSCCLDLLPDDGARDVGSGSRSCEIQEILKCQVVVPFWEVEDVVLGCDGYGYLELYAVGGGRVVGLCKGYGRSTRGAIKRTREGG